MAWPQISIIVILCVNLFLTAAMNGRERTGEHNFPLQLCAVALWAWLLWCGGFFA